MSRHLMARFRHLHAAGMVPWEHGRPMGWSGWNHPDRGDVRTNPDDHSSALVYHGEQEHSLEVMPSSWSKRKGDWTWGIFRHAPDPEWPKDIPGDDLTFPGAMWRLHPDSQARYYGQAPSREEAMQEAQDNWEAHKAHVDARNPLKNDGGGYDINDIMREQGF